MSVAMKTLIKNQLTFIREHLNVAVFGAGKGGVQVANWLERSGVTVSRFYDNDPNKSGTKVHGIEVYTPTEDLIHQLPIVIASTWNHEIVAQLEKLQCNQYIDASLTGLSITPIDDTWIEGIDRITQRLADDASKAVLEDICTYLVNHGGNFPQSQYSQYLHPNISLPTDAVVVDAGAYDGDSTIELADYYTSSKTLIAFEPDDSNINKFEQRLAKRNDSQRFELAKYGLWDRQTSLFFTSSDVVHGASCSLDSDGDIEVSVIDLDYYCKSKNHSVDMIKMDIEGAEYQALVGSQAQIKTNQPTLAICVYHYFDDLWRLADYIDSLGVNYTYYLGHHSNCWFETVLYAIPRNCNPAVNTSEN